MKLPYILFFIEGPFPSDKEKAEKASISNAKVVFRNATAVPPENHALETCDGVTGKVPEIYAKTFPNAETAISAYKEALKSLSAKVGDVPAPKVNMPNPNPPALQPAGNSAPQAPGKPPAWNPNPNPPA
jgi:hypothetical protein